MSIWHTGKVVRPRNFLDSHVQRFFNGYQVAWVIARHNNYIYLQIRFEQKEDLIIRCHVSKMDKYFAEEIFHDEMPYFKGKLKNIKIFPDDFFLYSPPEPGRSND